jgi:hypothetical protein
MRRSGRRAAKLPPLDLSRIRELRSRGTSTQNAIVGGISSSAGVVTSAAVIMVTAAR